MMKRFVIGDIHGAFRAMMQCFAISGFDTETDLLISLGDLGDGWPETDKVLDTLSKVKNLILIIGNHDQWLIDWLNTGNTPPVWITQGGDSTVKSLEHLPKEPYKLLMSKAKPYYLIDDMLFVHGGILTDQPLESQDESIFCWDRSLIKAAMMAAGGTRKLTPYSMVFVGHTPTINFETDEPIVSNGVCMMDTGAGWDGGKLSMMNIDTGELFSSDQVDELYSESRGRS